MVADSWSYHQNTTRLTASRLGSSSMFRRVRPARLILLCWETRRVSDRHERAAVGNWNARPRSRESQRLSGIPDLRQLRRQSVWTLLRTACVLVLCSARCAC